MAENQFALMSTALLGGLLLSTAAFALNVFLMAYLLIRYTSAWVSYRSYAITSAVLIFAVWLTLLVATAVMLPRENKATQYRQFGAMVSVVTISVTGFLAAGAVAAIGLTQSQRTLTSDLRIVRSFFGTILGLTGLAFLWVLIAGSMVLKRSKNAFILEDAKRIMAEQESKREQAGAKDLEKLPEQVQQRRIEADRATKRDIESSIEINKQIKETQEALMRDPNNRRLSLTLKRLTEIQTELLEDANKKEEVALKAETLQKKLKQADEDYPDGLTMTRGRYMRRY